MSSRSGATDAVTGRGAATSAAPPTTDDDAPLRSPEARLRATAAERGEHPALRWRDRTISYRELDERVDAAAAGLAAVGVGPGDRVALALPNTPTFVEAWFAVQRLGAVAVPAAPSLAAGELRHVLADSGAVAVVAAADLVATVEGLRSRLPSLATVIAAGETAPEEADAQPGAQVDGAGGDGTWFSLLERGARTPDVSDATDGTAEHTPAGGTSTPEVPDDLAALMYTSGTTGRVRGAMLSATNLAVNQDQSLAGRLTLRPDDVVLAVLPLFHIYGLNVVLGAAVAVGSTIVLQERFDPVATAELIAEHGVTVVPGAPPMYAAWAASPSPEHFASVRLCVSGAAALPRAVSRAFTETTGLDVHEGYGLTEASPSVTSSTPTGEVRPGEVGVPLPGVELRLVDRDGDVEEGDPGEVWVRGPNVFAGYWRDEEATRRTLTGDGWLRTGDVGVLDEDGWLRLLDRRTDVVLVSGFTVYPREVERVLRRHPAVAEAAVVGAPHPRTGETPVAHVVPSGDAELDPADLDAHCRAQLPHYTCPTSYRVVESLPLTATGKVRRTDLRLD